MYKRQVDDLSLRMAVKKVVPESSGRILSIAFFGTNNQIFEARARSVLMKIGTIDSLDKESAAEQERRDAELREEKCVNRAQVSQVNTLASFFSKALEKYGDGGNSAKKRRVTARSIEAVSTSIRVASAGLREAKEVTHGDEYCSEGE